MTKRNIIAQTQLPPIYLSAVAYFVDQFKRIQLNIQSQTETSS